MRLFLSLVLVLATVAFSFQLYKLLRQLSVLKAEMTKLDEQIQPIDSENKKLTADLKYLQQPGSLEGELRRAGYARPGEKMFVIIPEK